MRSLQKFTLAFVLYLMLALDASLSLVLHQFLALAGGINLLLPISVMLIALFDDMNQKEIWLALGAGIVSDFYFFGVLGLYTVALPGICWLLQRSARFLPEVFWARIVAVLLAVVALCIYSWLVLNITGLARVPLLELLVSLGSTLVWSFGFATLTYKMWAWLATSYPFMVKRSNY
ncbi:rod shape-determining protein MreD [Lactobacillus xylocopicola]|uniref:Rod shape-determining protein MreD n=1 Tax=Lactobacillus xylocopicola TaxID=2976676 RepID=A0ABN6SLA5_9LACO|nr:rod shape-determining protein MreD [Lactobacillus xylocopicola]BDR60389.1 rod shape-determining protein MreD [Lactobacillus xylocopicola]